MPFHGWFTLPVPADKQSSQETTACHCPGGNSCLGGYGEGPCIRLAEDLLGCCSIHFLGEHGAPGRAGVLIQYALPLRHQQYLIDEVVVMSTTVCANDCLALMTWRIASESCEPDAGLWSRSLDGDGPMARRGALHRQGDYNLSSPLGTGCGDCKPADCTTMTPSHSMVDKDDRISWLLGQVTTRQTRESQFLCPRHVTPPGRDGGGGALGGCMLAGSQ